MAAASTSRTGLAAGTIGLREVLFQSVTSMAPAGAVALSIAAGATYAGGALPLAVLLALIACLLVASSIGAPLAEEARDPRRTIKVAVITSCLAIGIFYVFTTYAGDVFFGPRRYVGFGALGGGSPWIQLARDVWGVGWVLVFLAIVNSAFANGNAGTLASTRTWYAMARVGVLPAALARTHPRFQSPYVGVAVNCVITLGLGLPLGLAYGPTTAFVFLATILTGVMIAIYIVFNLSCICFFLRRRRSEFNWLLHLVIPVLGIIAFIPAFFSALGIGGSVLKFVSPLDYPSSEAGLAIGIWFIIGIGVLAYLYARHPERLPEMTRVFAPEPAGGPSQPGAAAEVD